MAPFGLTANPFRRKCRSQEPARQTSVVGVTVKTNGTPLAAVVCATVHSILESDARRTASAAGTASSADACADPGSPTLKHRQVGRPNRGSAATREASRLV